MTWKNSLDICVKNVTVLNPCFKGGFVPTPSDESINRGPVCEHMHALKRS